MKKLLLIFTLFCSIIASANDSIYVSIFCTAQGHEIYELEGHAAMRIKVDGKCDYTISWGMFDFNSPNFVYRFLKGETEYFCGMIDTERFLGEYRYEGRTVFEFPLNVPQSVCQNIAYLLNINLLPENRVYRYNYVKDNCSTRPMEIIEQALGTRIHYENARPELTTFREVMAEYHKKYPWQQFGIDLALGSGIDYKISPREKTFAPVLLTEMLPTSTYTIGGQTFPLCGKTIVHGDPKADITADPTPLFLTPIFIAWLLFGITLAFTVWDIKRKKVCRVFDTVLYVHIAVQTMLLAFLIFISTHEATSPNYNFLWLNPLSLIIPVTIWIKKAKVLSISVIIINFVALISYLAIVAAGVQTINAAFYPLVFMVLLRNCSYLYIAKWQTRKD